MASACGLPQARIGGGWVALSEGRRPTAPMKKFSASKKHEDFFCLDSLMAHLKGNAVTFPTVYCWSNNSKRLGNGGGVPVSGTYVPVTGTHPSNRMRQAVRHRTGTSKRAMVSCQPWPAPWYRTPKMNGGCAQGAAYFSALVMPMTCAIVSMSFSRQDAPFTALELLSSIALERFGVAGGWPATPRRRRLSPIHISEPTRLLSISYAVFCLKKKNTYTHTYSLTPPYPTTNPYTHHPPY